MAPAEAGVCYDGVMMRCRIYATRVVMLAFLGVMLAAGAACGPAAPAGQGGAPDNAVATAVVPTPTSPAASADESGWDGLGEPPPTPTLTPMERQYPILSGYFIGKIQRYETAAAAAAKGSGGTARRATGADSVCNEFVYDY